MDQPTVITPRRNGRERGNRQRFALSLICPIDVLIDAADRLHHPRVGRENGRKTRLVHASVDPFGVPGGFIGSAECGYGGWVGWHWGTDRLGSSFASVGRVGLDLRKRERF